MKTKIGSFLNENRGFIEHYFFRVLSLLLCGYCFYQWMFISNDSDSNIMFRDGFFASLVVYFLFMPNELQWHVNHKNSDNLYKIKDVDERIKFILSGGIDSSMRKLKLSSNIVDCLADGLSFKNYLNINYRFITGRQNYFNSISFVGHVGVPISKALGGTGVSVSVVEDYKYKNFDNKSFDEILKEISVTEEEFKKIYEEKFGMKFIKKMKSRFEIVYDAHPEKFRNLFLFNKLDEKLAATTKKQKVVKI